MTLGRGESEGRSLGIALPIANLWPRHRNCIILVLNSMKQEATIEGLSSEEPSSFHNGKLGSTRKQLQGIGRREPILIVPSPLPGSLYPLSYSVLATAPHGIIIPILHMRKLKLRKDKSFAPGIAITKYCKQGLSSG